MALLPAPHPFLGAGDGPASALVIGAPLDLTECVRAGTAEGPARIRTASEVIETFSPTLGADLTEIGLVDSGDVDCRDLDMAGALTAIEAAARAARTSMPILLGGEHTVTLAAIRALHSAYSNLRVVHLDAHADLRDEYEGLSFSHATVMRRVADVVGLGGIAQYGIRSATREEKQVARGCLDSREELQMPPNVRHALAGRAIYLTIDIDVLDPSSAPGTGCPEPGGPGFRELLGFIYSLRGLNIVAADVVEVLPAVDVNDITSVAAAKLVREIALAFGQPHGSSSRLGKNRSP